MNFELRTMFFSVLLFTSSCSISHKISKQAKLALFNDTIVRHAHIGISIYEPASSKYWYEYNPDKYFVPASNTKLFTLFAGMKYLGDSLPSFKILYKNDTAYILPGGDPTFLNPEYSQQNSFKLLKALKLPITFIGNNWKEPALGYGWSWDDYESDDMIERSAFPIYNNVIRWTQVNDSSKGPGGKLVFSEPDINWKVNFSEESSSKNFIVNRTRTDNIYKITFGREKRKMIRIPFVTNGLASAIELLRDTLNKTVTISVGAPAGNYSVIHSRPVDSLFIPMMHRSDNFFAEQTLLMASNEKLGYMSDDQMIKYLEMNDLQDIPQKPSWKDGSGLSRYNLFTPRDFVYILNKLKATFGLERLKLILPTGGTGTLSSLYKKDSGYIYAKTGTLSNHVALSGFLITKQNKLLIFSILLDNFQSGATPIRKAIEKFLSDIRQHF